MRYDPSKDKDFQLEKILNKGIEFQDNVRGGFVEFVTKGGLEEIHHNLGYIPIGTITILMNGPVILYAENVTQWTTTTLFLRSNASNVTVRLFVM